MFPHVDIVPTAQSAEQKLALQRVGARSPIAPPRVTVQALVCLLAFTTGATLFAAASTIAVPTRDRPVNRPAPASMPSVDGVTTVRAFYSAVNETLRTADSAPLDRLLAPGLVEHADRPDLPSGRGGLVRYLAVLRQAYPTLRFEVEDVLANGNLVTVWVVARVPGSPSVPEGLPAQDVSWRGMEAFRITDGQVAERWAGSDAPILVQSLARMPLDHWSSGTSLTAVARLTFAPGAEASGAALPGVGVIVVEASVLAVRGSGQAQVVRGSRGPVTRPVLVRPGTEHVLGPGDAVAFPSGTAALSLRNDGTEPVVALAVALLSPADAQGVQTAGPAGQPSRPNSTVPVLGGGLASAMLPLANGGRAIEYPGVTVTPLASLGLTGPARVPPGRVMVTLDRVILAPQVTLPPHPARGPVLLTVAVGNLLLVPAREAAQVRSGIENETIVSMGSEAPLTTGDSAVWDAGAVALLRGGYNTAGSALLLAIRPADEGGANAS